MQIWEKCRWYERTWGTPLLTGKEKEVAPSIATDNDQFESKLDKNKQREEGNLKEVILESSDACYTLSNALDMLNHTSIN